MTARLGDAAGRGFVLVTLVSERRSCSSRRRPASSTARACWPTWPWTAGCRREFAMLSDRLVTQNGILIMGAAALLPWS